MADEFKLFVGSLPADITKEEVELVFKTYGELKDVHVIPGDKNKSATGQSCAFVMYTKKEEGDTAISTLDGVYKIREGEQQPIKVNWARAAGGKGGKDSWGKGKDSWGKGYDSWGGKGGYDSWGGKGGYDSWGGKGGYDSWGKGGCWDSWGGKGGYGGKDGWGGKGWDSGKGWSDGGKGWSDGGKGGGGSGTKLFVGNLPQDITQEALEYVFKAYGTVQKTHIMAGKSKSGQNCAFVEYSKPEEAETALTTLHDKYEIKPGAGMIMVKRARSDGKGSGPY